jgi:hypothetical protein
MKVVVTGRPYGVAGDAVVAEVADAVVEEAVVEEAAVAVVELLCL